MSDRHRIALSFEDFQALVRGNQVDHDGVALVLQDVGIARLQRDLLDTMHERLDNYLQRLGYGRDVH